MVFEPVRISRADKSATKEIVAPSNGLAGAGESELLLDPNDMSNIMSFGLKKQVELSDSSKSLLQRTRTMDTGEIGRLLTIITVNCKNIDVKAFLADDSEKKGFLSSLFKKGKDKGEQLIAGYDSVEKQIEGTETSLIAAFNAMMEDIKFLGEEYGVAFERLRHLEADADVIKRKLTQDIPQMLKVAQDKADETKNALDTQMVSNILHMKNRLEKRLHDMELTAKANVQILVQIRLIQEGDSELAEKLMSSVINTIPLWRQQFSIGLTLKRQETVLKLQKGISDANNALLKSNANLLCSGITEVAEETEKGIFDIVTLEEVNSGLVSAITKVQEIRKKGSDIRKESLEKIQGFDEQLRIALTTC